MPFNAESLTLLLVRAAGLEIQSLEEHAHEFGGCEYLLVAGPGQGGSLRLLFAMPQLAGPFQQQVLGPEVIDSVAAAFRGVAVVSRQPPEPPFHLALDVDLHLLARLSAPQQDGWSRSLASLRLLLAGHPLRQVFRALEAGTLQAGPPLVCCNTPGQVYVIKPAADSVALIFPLRFRSRQDCAIGVACLQEFVEARRGPSLGRAPTCSYSCQTREVPGELAGLDLSAVLGPGGCNGGYLTLTFTRRHVSGPQMEGVVWSMATLHQFVAFHVKATKAMMHTRMRRRVMAMIELLGAGGGGGAGAMAV
ncbi:hypothetical protein PLESTB_001897300 [Pleodorina starrii]|uniref:Arp2/3 complex 34 kDa subunit n=1 Tax=Pleodorina starrii TaxID=330485 RepID=A0A9W6C2C0_9CHLO|nr:hypothetical protein PLESTB_001897300 [Pleodorina starrii]